MDSPTLKAAKESATESAVAKLADRLGSDETDKLWIRHAMQDLATELQNLDICGFRKP
jgi:hypothetical protein